MTADSAQPTLLLVAPLAAVLRPDGAAILTRKFLDGVLEYVSLWRDSTGGRIHVIMPRAEALDSNLDHVDVLPNSQPFTLDVIPFEPDQLAQRIRAASVVLGALVPSGIILADLCRDAGVPLVYITENDLKTRLQMVDAEVTNPLRRLKRRMWERKSERDLTRAAALAAGLQCNGTPTYEAYRQLCPRTILFFDNRISPDLVATDDQLNARTRELLAQPSQPLRLAFTGRLVAIKGAADLPLIAARLRDLRVPFTLDICGGGDQEPLIRRRARDLNLEQHLRLRGVLDFKTELVPFLSRSIDLFVCCHRQGDPSCTYLETMACAVPIAGYANDAWRGMAQVAGAGWVTPLNNPRNLADQIAQLNSTRPSLAAAARTSLTFARQHLFDATMKARIDHVRQCMASQVAPLSER